MVKYFGSLILLQSTPTRIIRRIVGQKIYGTREGSVTLRLRKLTESNTNKVFLGMIDLVLGLAKNVV